MGAAWEGEMGLIERIKSIARHKPVEVWVGSDGVRVTKSFPVLSDDGEYAYREYEPQLHDKRSPTEILIDVLRELGIDARPQ
jgi:hypothetical protein